MLICRSTIEPQSVMLGPTAADAEREALKACLGDDLRDAFRMFEQGSGHWSWWDYRSGAWNGDRGWRIDHLYLDEELQQRALACEIHKSERGLEKPSDHAPVSVDLADETAEEEDEDLW